MFHISSFFKEGIPLKNGNARLFSQFAQLIDKYFISQRGIHFYAEKLSVTPKKLIKYTLFVMTIISVIMLIMMSENVSINIILVVFFFYLFGIGILYPTTTDLAITPFTGNSSGTASSLFGTIQIAVTFICTLVSGLMMNGTVLTIGIALFLCCVVGFILVFGKIKES